MLPEKKHSTCNSGIILANTATQLLVLPETAEFHEKLNELSIILSSRRN